MVDSIFIILEGIVKGIGLGLIIVLILEIADQLK